MGYVPPTLEEWNNPELMEKKIRRKTVEIWVIIGFGVAGFISIAVLAIVLP